jgi:hypothetical protein
MWIMNPAEQNSKCLLFPAAIITLAHYFIQCNVTLEFASGFISWCHIIESQSVQVFYYCLQLYVTECCFCCYITGELIIHRCLSVLTLYVPSPMTGKLQLLLSFTVGVILVRNARHGSNKLETGTDTVRFLKKQQTFHSCLLSLRVVVNCTLRP